MARPLGPADCHASGKITARTHWLLIRDEHLDNTHLSALSLCGHCSDKHALALTTDGWCQAEDQRTGAPTKPYEGQAA